jgi:type IV pilus assembly protein PilE
MELVLVLAVLAILAAIALPAYQESVRKSNRADARAILAETAQAMERYFTTNNTYVGATVIAPASPKGASGTAVKYAISFTAAPTADAFVVQAVPQNSQAGDSCGTLTLSNTGAQGPSTAGCW